MRIVRWLSICIAILAVFITCVPALANGTTSFAVPIKGIETNAGTYSSTSNSINGATFYASTIGLPGVLSASIDYQGTGPIAYGKNDFTGGKWSLIIIKGGKLGTIAGGIASGSVSWSNDTNTSSGPNDGTEIGTVTALLSIASETGVCKGITSASFTGEDNHQSGIWITVGKAKIQVPSITGALTLNY